MTNVISFDGPIAPLPPLRIEVREEGATVAWWVTNDGHEPLAVDRVALRFASTEPPTLFNGFQSWSYAGPAPSVPDGRSPGLVRAMHHADPTPGDARSELVIGFAGAALGFDGGSRHDGTIRVHADHVVAEAYLGGAVLAAGERRELHAIRIAPSLDDWARWAGAASAARTDAPYQVGWCSWYHYFHDVTEAHVRHNLALAAEWPFDVFQLDDGYQAAIGDWLTTNDKFPAGIDRLATDIAGRGLSPGIWIAPFLASPDSSIARRNPEWILKRPSGRAAVGMVNEGWGGDTWVLDTTRPDVVEHLRRLATELVAMGWTYLKLDFTYAPSLDANWDDPSLTPAQRVRQAYDAIRAGAGDDAFILGCGAPLGACIGVVDGMRIGPDVAPHWEPKAGWPGYEPTAPSTANALRNAEARQFMHRRLWLNDPDCLMLRTSQTELTGDQVRAWAMAVGNSGGMAIVSDDLALLGSESRALLDEVLAAGRAADDRYR